MCEKMAEVRDVVATLDHIQFAYTVRLSDPISLRVCMVATDLSKAKLLSAASEAALGDAQDARPRRAVQR